MNYKSLLTIAAAGAVLSLYAGVPAPQVSAVSMSQNSNGEALITYSLSAARAVITLDIQTNATGGAWASIGGEAVSGAQGDVWKVVATGSRRIKWDATTCWAGHQIPASGIRAVVTAWGLDNTPDYVVVDISSSAQPSTQRYYPRVDFLPGGLLGNDIYRKTTIVMRKIMAKDVTWTMGSTTLETLRHADNREATHQVTLTNNYYIGVFEVTQSQWDLIQTNRLAPSVFANPSDRAMRPVENVCYNEIRNNDGTSKNANTDYDWPARPNDSSFLGLLRSRTGTDDFDLPSESQWEFACRAGNGDTKWGDGSTVSNVVHDLNLDNLCRYKDTGGDASDTNCTAENGTAICGSYRPNSWGLYDMHGNVWEWCLDWYEQSIATAIATDGLPYGGRVNIDIADSQKCLSGSSPAEVKRVRRGGGIDQRATFCRSAARLGDTPQNRNKIIGFRVVCRAGLK